MIVIVHVYRGPVIGWSIAGLGRTSEEATADSLAQAKEAGCTIEQAAEAIAAAEEVRLEAADADALRHVLRGLGVTEAGMPAWLRDPP